MKDQGSGRRSQNTSDPDEQAPSVPTHWPAENEKRKQMSRVSGYGNRKLDGEKVKMLEKGEETR